jgi:hypothetical protein
MKKPVVALFLALTLVVFLSGCGGADNTATTSTSTTSIQPALEAPITVTLAFPDGAPKLNTSSAFTCTITNNEPGERKMTVTVNAPETAFVLESGSLSWSGTVPGNSQTTVVQAILKSYHTGHWQIDAAYHIDAAPGAYGGDFTTTIYIQSGIPSSQWGTTPPWQK